MSDSKYLEINDLCEEFSDKLDKYCEKHGTPGYKKIVFKYSDKPFPKYRLFKGLFGVSSDGVLTTPSGKHSIKIPKRFAFRLQEFLNEHVCYVGEIGTKLLFRSDY